MGKLDKLRKALKIGSTVGKPFVPGGIGTILDVVNAGLEDEGDPENEQAISAMALAIAELNERLEKLEQK